MQKERGLIDYTHMETLVNELLDNPMIKEVLASEIGPFNGRDEFQDTSPIQLEIFLKLSKLANQLIRVGDPKQKAYMDSAELLLELISHCRLGRRDTARKIY
ncbi:MAG: UvrD-helicase domain-containing protein [Saprospiraceae bacterium]